MHIYRLFTMACMIALFAFKSMADNMNQTTLSSRQRHLVTVAALEAKGSISQLEVALGHALNDGLTVGELKESLSQLYAYTGFPRSLNALSTLQKVVDERQKAGKATTMGSEAVVPSADYDALAEGTKVQTQLCGGKAYKYAFAPRTDYYLKAHLFGDIFSDTTLTKAERELVTLGALSALRGCEAQLKAHVGGSVNMGVKKEELHQLSDVLLSNVGEEEAYRMKKAVAEVFGENFTEGKPIADRAFPIGEPNTAFSKYFIGKSYLALLNKGGKFPIHNVTFEPGCRNNWHIHHKGGQILVCVGGEGWYQAWGEAPRKLHVGDVVDIPAEVKHWHGATADSWFQHIAIEVPAEGSSNEWLEPVTDEVYNQLK